MMSTMQKFVAAVLVCALAASTLPAASSQNPACKADAQSLVNSCRDLYAVFDNRIQNRLPQDAIEAQLNAAIESTDLMPSPACCAHLQKTLSQGCRCDSNAAPVFKGAGIVPSYLYTYSRTGILACHLPTNTDTAPRTCPAIPLATATAPAPALAPL
ncbi:g9715 [Coccomyxa viridis]|uniref:G9715 protein n=1 Tax=Coccomyxa viridis TaxID=1274662 RepID=A0ABP1G400_9CHLO